MHLRNKWDAPGFFLYFSGSVFSLFSSGSFISPFSPTYRPFRFRARTLVCICFEGTTTIICAAAMGRREKCVSRSHPCKIAARLLSGRRLFSLSFSQTGAGKLDVFLMTIVTIHRTLGNQHWQNLTCTLATRINDSIKHAPEADTRSAAKRSKVGGWVSWALRQRQVRATSFP